MTARGDMTCSGYHFTSREAVSFNSDGFIGIAGWADDSNVRPILDGIENFINSTK